MKKTILVVEGDRGRRRALVELLSGAGYDVIAGEDFQAALQMVEPLGVDVLISDLHVSSSTAASARAAQRHRRAAKLLFMSRVPLPDGPAAPRTGDVLPLPLDRSAVLDKVRALLA